MCRHCPFGECFEDRRSNPVRGRNTKFRVLQSTAMGCTFHEFVPGSPDDPYLGQSYNDYLARFRENAQRAGETLVGSAFEVKEPAWAKVQGDVAELLEAASLWNLAATWNEYMVDHMWRSPLKLPEDASPSPAKRIAIVQMPRNYDATKLLTTEARKPIHDLQQSLSEQGMELKLSAPDIVGVRIPEGLMGDNLFSGDDSLFDERLLNLRQENREILETAHTHLEGRLSHHEFLFALAVKRTVRSDRLYQPLFEANVLKYFLNGLLDSGVLKFYVHSWSGEGADVRGRYRAASLLSLIAGKAPEKVVDRLIEGADPIETQQTILNDLPELTRNF